MPAHLGSDMGVINPGIWESRLMVNVHHQCKGLQTVITAVLTVMSGPENSQNNWLLIVVHLWRFYDDNMMQMILIFDHVGLIGA